jgi:L,D-transpeptidase-like protein
LSIGTLLATKSGVFRLRFSIATALLACVAAVSNEAALLTQGEPAMTYRLEPVASDGRDLQPRFSDARLGILEKLNRADREHLGRLREIVVPERWLENELAYSPMPARYEAGASLRKVLVVYLPGQAFGGYEFGTLVRWGPVSSGQRSSPTAAGSYSLNWKSIGHASTVDPDWFMEWYFNFRNREGFALHEYSLPGRPASHGCIRLLERDAQWLFEWGEQWTLHASGTRVINPGTAVVVVGKYDFDSAPPWRSVEWLSRPVTLLPPSVDADQ